MTVGSSLSFKKLVVLSLFGAVFMANVHEARGNLVGDDSQPKSSFSRGSSKAGNLQSHSMFVWLETWRRRARAQSSEDTGGADDCPNWDDGAPNLVEADQEFLPNVLTRYFFLPLAQYQKSIREGISNVSKWKLPNVLGVISFGHIHVDRSESVYHESSQKVAVRESPSEPWLS